jgi:hypothetical protein
MSELAFRRAGSGPPLVLLHGFLCGSRVWRTQLEGLADPCNMERPSEFNDAVRRFALASGSP